MVAAHCGEVDRRAWLVVPGASLCNGLAHEPSAVDPYPSRARRAHAGGVRRNVRGTRRTGGPEACWVL